LANGRFAVSSPLTAADGFVCYLIHGFFDPHESDPKRHLDQYSCFCTAHLCAQQTDTHADHATCDVCMMMMMMKMIMELCVCYVN